MRDLLRHNSVFLRSPQDTISASINVFEKRYARIQTLAAVSEQQNCSHSMLKLARVLKVGPLDCI